MGIVSNHDTTGIKQVYENKWYWSDDAMNLIVFSDFRWPVCATFLKHTDELEVFKHDTSLFYFTEIQAYIRNYIHVSM